MNRDTKTTVLPALTIDLLREEGFSAENVRLQRTLNARTLDTPEHRARLAEEAMAVVNEHPNANVRKLYAGEVATKVGLPVGDLVQIASGVRAVRRSRSPPRRSRGPMENAEFAALVLLVQDWDEIAPVADRAVVRRRRQPDGVRRDGRGRGRPPAGARSRRPRRPRGAGASRGRRPQPATRRRGAHAHRCCSATRIDRARTAERPRSDRGGRAARLDIDALNDTDRARALAAAESLLGWLDRRTGERNDGG